MPDDVVAGASGVLAGVAPDERPSGSKGLLSVRNLEILYGEASIAVRGISFEVPERGCVALLGANGAGKTSTLRAITGLLGLHGGRIADGEVSLRGDRIDGLSPHVIVARGIAQVPEGRKVFAHLTVEEHLRIGATARAKNRAGFEPAQVYELFPSIADRRKTQVGWLSGGEQQMVVIGRALMAAPQLLLLDEVSLGLAPLVVESIVDRLRVVREDTGLAILMVEQNAEVALEFTDWGHIMENGRIALDGPSSSLLKNEAVKASYLGISESSERTSFAVRRRHRRSRGWLE